MTITTDTELYSYAEIDAFLARYHLVAVIWSTGDVLECRGDLTDDQAWEVLQECRSRYDCEVGFNWDLVQETAEELYPRPEDVDE